MAVEYAGQTVERCCQMCALQLAAQVRDLLLRGAQAVKEFFLLILHQLGAFLQIAEYAG